MDKVRFILAGRFIDGNGTDVQRGILLTVQDTIITAIGSAKELPSNKGGATDDFSHCTILPALVDCSVSLSQSPSVDSSVRLFTEEADFATKLITLKRHIHDCHTHGVLGVADSGQISELLNHSQEEMLQNSAINIKTSGSLCQSTQKCATANATAVDFFKIAYSASIEDDATQQPQLSLQELSHIVQHTGEKKVVVVANGSQQVAEAIEAGCDAIEQGYNMGEDNLREMVKKNVLWIPSVVRARNGLDGVSGGGDVCGRFSTRYVAPGKPNPGAKKLWEKILSEQLVQLQFARDLGITTAIGTGAGIVGILHGESMVEEMKLFLKAGYSLEETIRCASEHGARFFDMQNLGTLTVGQRATFLITRGTAKQLPRKLSYLENIYVDGVPSPAYSKHPVMR